MEIIDDIMDNFDFDKVHEAMSLLGWRWWIRETDSLDIPDIPRLRNRARGLMKEAMNSTQPEYDIATGGFQVHKETIEGEVFLSLSFVLTEWNNYA